MHAFQAIAASCGIRQLSSTYRWVKFTAMQPSNNLHKCGVTVKSRPLSFQHRDGPDCDVVKS